MIRILWTMMIALIGVVAFGAQLDRQARYDVALADQVPGPFRSFAQTVIASEALLAGDPRTAVDEARLLVSRRPLPSQHLALLAWARQSGGDQNGAIATVLVAGSRGWRDTAVQAAILDLALQAGDHEEAAKRLVALWVVGDDQLARDSRLGPVLETPRGRDVFVEYLAAMPHLQADFLRQGSSTLPAGLFAATLTAATERGVRLDCKELSIVALGLVARGHAEPARAIWSGSCAAAAPALSPGSGFYPQTGAPTGPFDWQYPDAPELERNVRKEAGRWVMDAEGTGPGMKPVAAKWLRPISGPQTWRIAGQSEDSILVSSASCVNETGQSSVIARKTGEGDLVFSVLDGDCSGLRLDVHMGRGVYRGLYVARMP